ncbi:MAG: sterol desaturase family protein [Parvularculaceae bacterium]|nr:sterol desaturase family protein [Parvularculaceae bacterium]
MTAFLTVLTISGLISWALLERGFAAFPKAGGLGRIGRNLGFGLLGLATTFIVVTPISLAATGWGPAWRTDWSPWLRLVSDLLILELFIYAWHRAMHEVPFLWRFHRSHHLDEFLDVSSALRFHPGEVILSAFLRSVVIIGADVGWTSILIFDALVILAAGFHHSNVQLPPAWDQRMRLLMVSPRHHRIHHIPERRYTDSNYGTILSVWDRLLGSFEDVDPVGRYGVEGLEDRPLPQLVADPLRAPS